MFDTEALTGLARNHALRAAVELLDEAGWDVQVPVVILSEGMTGRPREDATTHRTIHRFGTVETDEACARYAGELRARARRGPTGVDAMVAAHAALADEAALIFTSDVRDLSALLAGHSRVAIRRVP